MAGTSVDDGGAVASAFRTALDAVGLDPDRPRGSTDRATVRAAGGADPDRTVRATMGQAKLAVFTALLGGDATRAARANAVFENAFGDAVDRGLVVPVDGARAAIESLQARGAAVGDTTSDLIAGTRAGASLVVGVLTGAHGLDELLTAPHTHVIGSIRELPDLVEAHGPADSHPVAADGDAATP